MSGEESLAQVYREIEHPKVKNLKRTGMIIFVYSLLFTSLVSFFATAIIPDAIRPKFYDNLISGLAMNVVGPVGLRLAFQGFVVIVGFLILAGAVNTAIVGSNGVLNRVSEDGVLTEWFRMPHKRYGTTHRLINLSSCSSSRRSCSAEVTCTFSAKRTRSASSGASRSNRSRCSCFVSRSATSAANGRCRST